MDIPLNGKFRGQYAEYPDTQMQPYCDTAFGICQQLIYIKAGKLRSAKDRNSVALAFRSVTVNV